ncbi:MAG: phytoene/squalene synthase family protein [Acidobacteria bacterium]|nr:phytoene/squalene synthase family protein [Acidobacteriota bacterium]
MKDPFLLAKPAFDYCQKIVKHHAKSFYFCGHFLPFRKRIAMFAIYALCRTLDDIVDESPREAKIATKQALNEWQEKIELLYSNEFVKDPILVAMKTVLSVYPVNKKHFLDLIAGVEMDLNEQGYETFADLRLYCYRVAATVGLMGSEVFGYSSKDALPKAESLGIAMQLTNILRDIGEDFEIGRIYLPKEDLRNFNYREEDLKAKCINENFIALMKFQIKRARAFYREADEGIKMLEPDSRLTVLAASRLYGAILDQIERNCYDVFTMRASLSLSAKIMRLPNIWLTRQLKFA